MIRVTIFNEFIHETRQEEIRKIYPEGIHGCIKNFLLEGNIYEKDNKKDNEKDNEKECCSENSINISDCKKESENELVIRTATFEEPEHGLTQEVIDNTDVLIFWNHWMQDDFSDEVAERIHKAVLGGMGFVALHSAHFSKPLKLLLGTSMTLRWRHGDRERIFITSPSHPIAEGLPDFFELPEEEMYGEYFDIPKPDDVVFTGWFAGGEVFRSGCTFTRGLGKIFYFQPGHEQYPVYYDKNIQKVIKNAVYWAAPVRRRKNVSDCTEVKIPLEK